MAKPLFVRADGLMTESIPPLGASGPFNVQNQQPSRATIVALVAATVVFGLAYAPNLRELESIWSSDPNYSHGYLIVPIALFILWRRLTDIPAEPRGQPFPALGGDGSV